MIFVFDDHQYVMSYTSIASGQAFSKSAKASLILISGCPPPIQKNCGFKALMQWLKTMGMLVFIMIGITPLCSQPVSLFEIYQSASRQWKCCFEAFSALWACCHTRRTLFSFSVWILPMYWTITAIYFGQCLPSNLSLQAVFSNTIVLHKNSIEGALKISRRSSKVRSQYLSSAITIRKLRRLCSIAQRQNFRQFSCFSGLDEEQWATVASMLWGYKDING